MAINKNIITRRTVGSNSGDSQIFLTNNYVNYTPIKTEPFVFDVPLYSIEGATSKYYAQDVEGISSNLNNVKSLTFNFSANNYSFSADTIMAHDLYRIPYPLYSQVLNGATASTITQEFENTLIVPYTTILEYASGFTINGLFSSHTLNIPATIKREGNYTENIFGDKYQYFIDTRFLFQKNVDLTLGSLKSISGNSVVDLYEVFSGTSYTIDSGGMPPTTISGGTFAGKTIKGFVFTYFNIPNKPDINVGPNGQPSVYGNLDTLSPIWSFAGVKDADYYKLQISYDITNTVFASSAVTVFDINKQEGDDNFIRSFSISITPETSFLYRIGNTKELINIFGVKQNITTWSNYSSGRTANNGTFILSGNCYFGFVSPANKLSGVKVTVTLGSSLSTIDLGADTMTNSNTTTQSTSPLGGGAGSIVNATYSNNTNPFTDTDGFYTFGRQNGGFVTISAQVVDPFSIYKNQTITKNILLNQLTEVDFVFNILWGNTNIFMGDTFVQFFD